MPLPLLCQTQAQSGSLVPFSPQTVPPTQLWLMGRSWCVLVSEVTAVLLPPPTVSPCWGPHGLLCSHSLASHLNQRATGLTRDRKTPWQGVPSRRAPFSPESSTQ